mgnify:CR=1 FL=1
MSKHSGIHPMIRQIVDRCHVGDSHLTVIRYFVSRLKTGHATWLTLDRRTRRDWICQIVARHNENQELYRDVMKGGI